MKLRATGGMGWVRRSWIPALGMVWMVGGMPAKAEVGRPWDLSLRVFTEYNDDVPLAADNTAFTGNQESLGAGLAAAGGLPLYSGRSLGGRRRGKRDSDRLSRQRRIGFQL